jgi:hypothetical protein
MKYFKPELLARCRSRDDDDSDQATTEWQKARTAYRTRLKRILAELPSAVAELCSSYSLHDARVVGGGYAEDPPRYSILLRLEGSRVGTGAVLQLNYVPAKGPTNGVNVLSHGLAEKNLRGNVFVLYDEFDIDRGHDCFVHSLLLTDGRELEIRFNELTIGRFDQVVTPDHLEERRWPASGVTV